ncbi:MAG: hypothetical protein H0X33_10015 [Taibaiella sp.]|nr:hypothetical protein [Taibaiella sp.]
MNTEIDNLSNKILEMGESQLVALKSFAKAISIQHLKFTALEHALNEHHPQLFKTYKELFDELVADSGDELKDLKK